MWNKNEKPAPDPQPDEIDAQCGDQGGPIGDVDPDAIVASEERLRELEERLVSEVEDWKGKYTRSLADFQNYQRRSIENEKEARRQGVTSVVSNLLGVLDNFELALQQDPAKATAEQIIQGVTMIRMQMLQALAATGVAVIDPRAGDVFDPHRHEAVAHIPAPQESIAPGSIAQLFQTGYSLGDRVLRPAKVAVAKGPE